MGDNIDSIKEEIFSLSDTIQKTIPVSAIILFVSFASGVPTSDSDIDLYVIIPDNTMRVLDAMQKISLAISSVQKRPVDVLVGTQTSFDHRSLSVSNIEKEVLQKGVIVCGNQSQIQRRLYA